MRNELGFWPTMSIEETKRLLGTVQKYHKDMYSLIFWTVASTEFTMSKVLTLRVNALDAEGLRLEDVKVPEVMTKRLSEFIARHQLGPKDRIFPVSTRRVFTVFKRAAKRAGLDPVYTPYSLRYVRSGKYLTFSGYRMAFRTTTKRRRYQGLNSHKGC